MFKPGRIVSSTLALAVLLTATSGCGMLAEELAFTIDSDWQQLTVDSATLGVNIPSATVIPAIPCQKTNDICAKSTSVITCSSQKYSCAIQCSNQSKCEIVASAEESFKVDLSQKIKNNTSAKALSKVSLSRVAYQTLENSLTFDTPKIEVFVGPNTANKTTDPGVVRFATMPVIPKKTVPSPANLPDITQQGRDALSNFVKNYHTPFKFLVKASLRFSSGDAIPKGRLKIQMKAYFHITPL